MTPHEDTERPVRVLVACDHIDYDGALHGGGRQLIELARALEEDPRVEPTICVLRPPSALGAALVRDGLPFVFLGHVPLDPRTLVELTRLIRAREIDVLHLTDYGACTFGRLAGMLTRRPSIVQVISHHSPHQRKGFPLYVEAAYRALAPVTAKALAISESVKAFAVERMGFTADDVEVLSYPLPKYSWAEPTAHEVRAARERHGLTASDRVIGAVTRFYPSKGIEYLVRAFAEVAHADPRARLMLLGQGPLEERLRSLATELGVAERVVFAGFQRQAQAYVAGFDVAVTPSIEEGFGLVALEAQALGVPVVASRVGGLPDVVAEEESGILIEPANVPALAAALRRLLDDDSLRARMSTAARRQASRFSLDAYAGRLVEIYLDLARKRTAPPSATLGE